MTRPNCMDKYGHFLWGGWKWTWELLFALEYSKEVLCLLSVPLCILTSKLKLYRYKNLPKHILSKKKKKQWMDSDLFQSKGIYNNTRVYFLSVLIHQSFCSSIDQSNGPLKPKTHQNKAVSFVHQFLLSLEAHANHGAQSVCTCFFRAY